MNLGPTELVIILVIVIVLFGVGRLGRLGGELGQGIKSFREGLRSDEDDSTPAGTKGEETSSEEA